VIISATDPRKAHFPGVETSPSPDPLDRA
jgi:hypothetical protein